MKYWVTVNGKKFEVEVERKGDYVPLRKSYEAALPVYAAAPAPGQAATAVAPAPAAPVKAPVPASAGPAKAEGGAVPLASPFPGKVLEVKVQPGQKVAQGGTVLVIEAMKMETELAAPATGSVLEIKVKAGNKINTGDLLLLISAE